MIPKHLTALANHKGAAIVHAGGMLIPVKIMDIEHEESVYEGSKTTFKGLVVDASSLSTTELMKSAKAAAAANTPFGATAAFREAIRASTRYNDPTPAELRAVEMSMPCVVATRPVGMFDIDRVIFNNPATIVFWKDGTKTVVKCQEGDTYSPESGLAIAFTKKALGNKGNFNEVFKKHIPNY